MKIQLWNIEGLKNTARLKFGALFCVQHSILFLTNLGFWCLIVAPVYVTTFITPLNLYCFTQNDTPYFVHPSQRNTQENKILI